MKAAGFLDKYKDTLFVHIIQGGQIHILMSNLSYLKFFSSFGYLFCLFSYDLDEYSFSSFAIKLTVKNLFPWAKIKSATGNSNDNFPAH